MPWLRLESHFGDDKAFQSMSEISIEARLFWPQLLALAKQQPDQGIFAIGDTTTAGCVLYLARLPWTEERMNMLLAHYQRYGLILIDEKTVTVTNWEKYNPDPTNPQRQAAWRERKKASAEAKKKALATTLVTVSNGYVTGVTGSNGDGTGRDMTGRDGTSRASGDGNGKEGQAAPFVAPAKLPPFTAEEILRNRRCAAWLAKNKPVAAKLQNSYPDQTFLHWYAAAKVITWDGESPKSLVRIALWAAKEVHGQPADTWEWPNVPESPEEEEARRREHIASLSRPWDPADADRDRARRGLPLLQPLGATIAGEATKEKT